MLRSFKLMRLRKKLIEAFTQTPLPELPEMGRDPVYDLVQQLQAAFQRRKPPKPLHQKSVWELRSDARMEILVNRQFAMPLPDAFDIWQESIPSPTGEVPVRVYVPAGKGPFPIFIYLHGGGWTMGDLDTTHATALQIAAKTGGVIVSVDYRLAPEHPFPAALQDAYAVIRWCAVAENALSIRGDQSRMVVAGDSAGGNIAAAACLLNRDRQGPPIAYQLLLYPTLDLLHFDTPSYLQYAAGHGLTAEDVPFFVRHYIGDPLLATDPLVSPLLSTDLSGLPPTLIVVAEFDVLRSEAEEYAEKLKTFNIPVDVFFGAGMEHGFFDMQHLIPRANQYATQILQSITNKLSG